MMRGISKRVTVTLLTSVLVGLGGFEPSSILEGHEPIAVASATSTFNVDYKAAVASVKLSSATVKTSYSNWDLKMIKEHPQQAYDDIQSSFSGIAREQAYCLASFDYEQVHDDVAVKSDTSDYAKDWAGLTTLYNHFKTRFSKNEQRKLATLYAVALNGHSQSRYTNAYNFGMQLSHAIASLDSNGRLPVSKSAITKLSAKKTASKKYVKVTGTVKLYKTANYAHIKTYKGYRYAKLTSKHTFSKTIYAPKAKSVKVTVGHYSNGHYAAVTSAKSVRVK